MRILITNDDGVNAVGIHALAEVFGKEHEVTVIAPDQERSACSHSLTIHRDIAYTKKDGYGYETYAISGTPADCVKLGVLYLKRGQVDLVLSGINNGSNLGSDIMYSGTVAAAFEAAYLGLKAIAISLNLWNCDKSIYINAAKFLLQNLQALCGATKVTDVLNVNYPAHISFKGVRVTKAGINLYNDSFVDGKVSGAVRLKGVPVEHDYNDEDCDVELIKKGYATITPLKADRNNYDAIKLLNKAVKLL